MLDANGSLGGSYHVRWSRYPPNIKTEKNGWDESVVKKNYQGYTGDPMTSLNPLKKVVVKRRFGKYRGCIRVWKVRKQKRNNRMLRKVGILTRARPNYNRYPHGLLRWYETAIIVITLYRCCLRSQNPDLLTSQLPLWTVTHSGSDSGSWFTACKKNAHDHYLHHRLGVVFAVMYAGQIVEYGLINENLLLWCIHTPGHYCPHCHKAAY